MNKTNTPHTRKPLRKVELQFVAFKTFETPHDPIEELKTFCEDHNLQFCDVEIVKSQTECVKCGSYVSDDEMYADNQCFECYEDSAIYKERNK